MILKINFPKRGQKLTNGDVIKMMFPNTEIRDNGSDFITYTLDGLVGTCVEKKWWDAVYEVPIAKKMYSNGYTCDDVIYDDILCSEGEIK